MRKITAAGDVTTIAGSAGLQGADDGSGVTARFDYPTATATALTGELFVAEDDNDAIRKLSASAEVTTLAGAACVPGALDGTGITARSGLPYGMGIDSAGNLLVADMTNHAIRRVTPADEVTTVVGAFGKFGVLLGALPASLSSRLDVAIRSDGELLIVTANGVVVTQGFQ